MSDYKINIVLHWPQIIYLILLALVTFAKTVDEEWEEFSPKHLGILLGPFIWLGLLYWGGFFG